MPSVTILRREQTVRFPGPQQAEDVVEVTFVTDAWGVRSVALPVASYRPANRDELDVNPRYHMIPIDKKAEDAERKAIADAIQQEAAGAPASFDLP